MTASIIILPLDWFARQRRDEAPGAHRDGVVLQMRDYNTFDETAIFRRVLNLRAERARRSECHVYTSDDDGRPSA
jgi:hypothetical protein